MFDGDELANYMAKLLFRAAAVIAVVCILIGWGLAKLFD